MSNEQALREALRIFVGCAITVDGSIDDRGHTWCESYLDQALPIARQALALPTADEKLYLEGVNIERLKRAMSVAGCSADPSLEGLAADLSGHINRLTAAVVNRVPTQQSAVDGLPKPFGYVSDGFADGLRFQHKPWPVEHTLLHSTMPVFSAAAVQQYKEDAERDNQRLMDKHNALHINLRTCQTQLESYKEALTKAEHECEKLRVDAERWKMSVLISSSAFKHPDKRTETQTIAFNAYKKAMNSGLDYEACVDAAIDAARGQK